MRADLQYDFDMAMWVAVVRDGDQTIEAYGASPKEAITEWVRQANKHYLWPGRSHEPASD